MKKDWMIIESELDEKQIQVLNATNDRSCIVSGCAGSGKSVLALIKAQRIQREKGNNYQIIVFTKALCRYMNAGRKELGLVNQFAYHYQWKNREYCPSSDYVIVDEIQDFSKSEIQEFINATNKHFFFFGDTAQSIYEGLKDTMKVEDINNMLGQDARAKPFELLKNYRLPKKVANVVKYIGDDLYGFDIDNYMSKEVAMPRFVQYGSMSAKIEAIARLINSGAVSDAAILVPRNEDVKRISDMLNQNHINHESKYEVYKDSYGELVYQKLTDGVPNKWMRTSDNLDFTTENPKVMTYHSAKGLQFGTVFLPVVEVQTEDAKQKALYVAMTRTYRNLYVMYNGSLPYPLSKVPSNLYKTTEKDVVEDI